MGLVNSVNPELAAVESLIQKHGGVQGLVRQFEQQGLGSVGQSWVEKGENHPISSDQLYRALGCDTPQELGTKLGKTPGEVVRQRPLGCWIRQRCDAGRRNGPQNSLYSLQAPLPLSSPHASRCGFFLAHICAELRVAVSAA